VTHWYVRFTDSSRQALFVFADYQVIEGGVLIFRNHRRNAYAFPATVMAFAPGVWASVENLSIPKDAQ
jgi:hypothetical protein